MANLRRLNQTLETLLCHFFRVKKISARYKQIILELEVTKLAVDQVYCKFSLNASSSTMKKPTFPSCLGLWGFKTLHFSSFFHGCLGSKQFPLAFTSRHSKNGFPLNPGCFTGDPYFMVYYQYNWVAVHPLYDLNHQVFLFIAQMN